MTYPVNEIFETIQGEATHMGRPSVFVRMQGCPVGCPWCDTKHTWELAPNRHVQKEVMLKKVGESDEWSAMSAAQITEVALTYRARHAVITGGEPAIYDLQDLTESLNLHGFSTQVETSGTEPIRVSSLTFVTLSPKINMPGGRVVLPEAVARADEIKHPVAIERNVTELLDFLDTNRRLIQRDTEVWLQPVWQAPRSREICLETCKQHNFRMSVQTHKVLGLR